MTIAEHREVPFNYTSASDEQIVTFLFGSDTWSVLEQLRGRRVTGRSARLLMRFMGDMFILRRNPFLWKQLADSGRRRRELVKLVRRDLDTVERNARDEVLVQRLIGTCRHYLDDLLQELSVARKHRQRIRRVLGAVIGDANITFAPFALVSHATDATDWRLCLPLAVARPQREADVAPLLAAIARLHLHAIPRGAGTGLTGGAVPLTTDCVMVNTERLDHINSIEEREFMVDGKTQVASVMSLQAGVVTETAMVAAEKRDRVFATDPTSAWACTVGGNLAENAGGKSAVLWGTAIDNVLAFNLALPTGATCRVQRVQHPLRKIQPHDEVRFEVTTSDGSLDRTIVLRGDEIRKPNLWKDITNKALGGVPGLQKEGTDGVITSAEFILHRAYPEKLTVCLEFFGESMDEAARVILDIAQQFPDRGEEALQALEHFDEQYVRAIEYRTKAAKEARPKAVLLIDMVAHSSQQLARGRLRLETLLARYTDTHVFFARDATEATLFWADRKKMGAIAKRTNAFKLNEDIVLPLSALAEFARYIDNFNVAEERANQLDCVARARAAVTHDASGDGEWLAQKLPAALARCERAEDDLKNANADDLRQMRHVRRLQRDLVRLFAGYAAMQTDIESGITDERSRLIVIATHMHAGDGNVHVNIPVFSNDREMMKRAALVADTVMEHAVALGGVVSGEHGIGITKLKHLDASAVAALEAHRGHLDPERIMNPCKLADRAVLDYVFTPSFNLLELEAKILQYDQLQNLADRISKCVRCGKCKPNCCVYYPGASLFYHPRNKNLAIGSLIEALLYEAQRFRTTDFESLANLAEVADHCTICHKCLEPCPVQIDTGEVSVLEREILVARGTKKTALMTRLTLAYLDSTNRTFNSVFRLLVLRVGTAAQRAGARLMRWLGAARGSARGPLALLRSPVIAPSAKPLHRALPLFYQNQALVIEPESRAGRTVFYFPGCGSERLQSDVGKASIYLLLAAGCRVVLPPPLLCCGFPSGANAKTRMHDSKVLSDTIVFSQIRSMLNHFTFDALAVSCGTCREALHAMGAHEIFGCLLVDVSEFALSCGVAPPTEQRVLYHRPCHDSLDGHAPQLLVRAGIEVRSVPHCCSEAGTLALSRPDIAHKMLARKYAALATMSDRPTPGVPFVTNCPSCLQGLGRQNSAGIEPVHLAVLLARAHGGAKWQEALAASLCRSEVVNF